MKQFHNPDEAAFSFQKGEERGLKYFYDTLYAALCYFCFRIMKDKDDAEDIVIVAFEKIWDNRHGFTQAIKIKSWLYAVCRNASFDYLRDKKKLDVITKDITWIKQNEVSTCQEDDIIKAEVYRELYEHITKLPNRCRLVIELYLQGCERSKIVNKLNISESTINSQRQVGIEYLKAYFNGWKKPSITKTDNRNEEMKSLALQGRSPKEIAAIFSLDYRHVTRIVQDINNETKRKRYEEIAALYSQRMPVKEIADKFNMSISGVTIIAKKYGDRRLNTTEKVLQAVREGITSREELLKIEGLKLSSLQNIIWKYKLAI